jgi:hypothetical protein
MRHGLTPRSDIVVWSPVDGDKSPLHPLRGFQLYGFTSTINLLLGKPTLNKDLTSGLPETWEAEILVTAEDLRSLALVLRDCILQVFPRLFPSGRLRPAVR